MQRAMSCGRLERRSCSGTTCAPADELRVTPDAREAAPDSCRQLRLLLVVEELFVLGRAVQRGGRSRAAGHDLRDLVEVARADLALVLHRGEAFLGGGELLLLQ